MSYEFIQVAYDKLLDNNADYSGDRSAYEFEAKADQLARPDSGIALVLPKSTDGTHYNKALVECCINMLFECAQSLSKNIDYKKVTPEEFTKAVTKEDSKECVQKRKTEHNIDIEMTHQVREIAGLLQWISNSASWHEGEYYKFDKAEIERRLELIKIFSRT